MSDSFCRLTLRYEFISYSDSYDDYLMALGTPSWVLGLAKASSERITVSRRGEGEGSGLRWHFKTGKINSDEEKTNFTTSRRAEYIIIFRPTPVLFQLASYQQVRKSISNRGEGATKITCFKIR